MAVVFFLLCWNCSLSLLRSSGAVGLLEAKKRLDEAEKEVVVAAAEVEHDRLASQNHTAVVLGNNRCLLDAVNSCLLGEIEADHFVVGCFQSLPDGSVAAAEVNWTKKQSLVERIVVTLCPSIQWFIS